jgi:hypothetical protein
MGRRAINAPLLAAVIFKSHAEHAYVEGVGARPGEGAVGAFAFGRARGVIEGVLAAAGLPSLEFRLEPCSFSGGSSGFFRWWASGWCRLGWQSLQ